MLGVVEPVAFLVVGINANQLFVLGPDGCLKSHGYFTPGLGRASGLGRAIETAVA